MKVGNDDCLATMVVMVVEIANGVRTRILSKMAR